MDFEYIKEKLDGVIQAGFEYAPKLVLAIVTLFIGLWIIKNLERIIGTWMERSGLSNDIRPFLQSLLSVALKVLLVFTVASMVGIETTSFVAVLGAMAFAVGMALQGSLGNFAAGVMVLIFKPYKTGDWIEIGDNMGKVSEIQMFNTIIKTFTNKTIIIPNGIAISDVITNLSTDRYVRLDLNVYMPYEEEFEKVRPIILEALRTIPEVLEEPLPDVGIEQFDTHSIILAVRPYCLPDDYGKVHLEALRKVKAALGANGIKVAYSEGVELGKIGK